MPAFEIVETVPNQRVVWLCLKAYIDMNASKKKDERVGTRLIRTITGDVPFVIFPFFFIMLLFLL